jgi:cyclopropane fatty-acyl-phospholipid synthase-like methyltransferase
VGCFNGAFLDYLGPDWDRHGVEPSRLAAGLARTRGVQVHARLLDDLPATETFDVITAFDVIEHVVDPALFFGMIRRHLRPNGIAVFSSGDTDSLSWRLQLARYWYCSYLPEHVSFYCRHALNYLASANQMVSVHHSHMSHKRTALSVQAKQAAKGVAYAMLLRLNWLGLPSVRAKYAKRGGTDWVAARDHFVHVMKAL